MAHVFADMLNFKSFVGIDWSGAKGKRTSSIQVAIIERDASCPTLIYPPTYKNWSRTAIADWIEKQTHKKTRTLIGIDCNFGYGAHVMDEQLGEQATAQDLWAHIEDVCADVPHYYALPFWEKYSAYYWMGGKQPEWFDFEKLRRETEWACGRIGLGQPESPFKLFSPTQVGKGGLAGMRMLHDLKARCGERLAVWPFDAKTQLDEARVVVTEIYPRLFIQKAKLGAMKIRKGASLNLCLEKLGSGPMPNMHDVSDHAADAIVSAAGLRQLCGGDKNIPHAIAFPANMSAQARAKEGWIFGVI